MLEQLLPGEFATAEVFSDLQTVRLWPGEESLVVGAVPRRAREFATTRDCARRAMHGLGVAPSAVLRGPAGAPVWPTGVVGSLTHCDGFRGAAVARTENARSVGIDAEPHAPMPVGVAGLIARPAESDRLALLAAASPDVAWDRVLFCAKEALYKAWFPSTGRWLNFTEVEVTLESSGIFAAVLADHRDAGSHLVHELTGRWLVDWDRSLVLAAAYALQVAATGEIPVDAC